MGRLAWLWPWHQNTQQHLASHLRRRVLLGLGLRVRVSCWDGAGPTTQLRGLVVGLGALGVREPEEASIAIPDSFDGE